MKQDYVPRALLQALREHTRFILIGHEDPDGDCLSSQYTLASYLERQGANTVLVTPGPFERPEIETYRSHFLSHIPPDTAGQRSMAIVLDCSTIDRIGYLADELQDMPVAVIDHHSAGLNFGDVRFIDPAAPSVTFMILHIIEAEGDSPTAEEARCLLFGLATDTGYFRHLSTGTEHTFEAVSRLVAAGANPKEIYHWMYGGRSLESKLLLGRLLSRSRQVLGGKAIITYETMDDSRQFGKQHRDSDSLYGHLQGVRDNELVVLIREEAPGRCTIGLRSHAQVDVGELAREFGGGGHARAAGFSWQGERQDVEQALLQRLNGTL